MSLKFFSFFFLFFFFSSCSKMSYFVEQGIGQIKIQYTSVKNKEVLNNPEVGLKVKRKIRLIQEYKKWFYHYFGKKKDDIYSRTTFLKSSAVTYLVITSPYNKIEGSKECFLFFGCFPYLGFFEKKSALEYKKDKEKQEFYAYIRPVYAYSTLGYFSDPILSSFFIYDDYSLAETVFHELFHTIFFVKNQVSFNENLANYFGKELTKEYFKNKKQLVEKKEKHLKKSKKMNQKIVQLVKQYSIQLNRKTL